MSRLEAGAWGAGWEGVNRYLKRSMRLESRIRTNRMSNLLQEYQADSADIAAIVGGYHGAPHTVLGPHAIPGVDQSVASQAGVVIRAFRPLDPDLYQ